MDSPQRLSGLPYRARQQLTEDGYIYVDETRWTNRYTDELPDRGWYIAFRPDGEPFRLRITDEPYDGPCLRTDVCGEP